MQNACFYASDHIIQPPQDKILLLIEKLRLYSQSS